MNSNRIPQIKSIPIDGVIKREQARYLINRLRLNESESFVPCSIIETPMIQFSYENRDLVKKLNEEGEWEEEKNGSIDFFVRFVGTPNGEVKAFVTKKLFKRFFGDPPIYPEDHIGTRVMKKISIDQKMGRIYFMHDPL